MRNIVLFLIALLLTGSEVQPGPGGVISVKATSPISVTSSRSPTVSYLPRGSPNQFYVWNGTAWVCQTVPSSVVESDPIFAASVAHAITNTDVSNWNMAFGWGNHASAGYLTSETDPLSIRKNFGQSNGQVPAWNGDAGQWGATTPSGGSGGVWTPSDAGGAVLTSAQSANTGNPLVTVNATQAQNNIDSALVTNYIYGSETPITANWSGWAGFAVENTTDLVCTTKRIRVEYKP